MRRAPTSVAEGNDGWTLTRLRYAAAVNPSKSEVSDLDDDTVVAFVPMEAVGEDGSMNLSASRELGEVRNGYTYFRSGDVVVAKITPCFENGKAALTPELPGIVAFGTTELIVIRARDGEADGAFLYWLTRTEGFRAFGEAAMYGAGGQKRVPEDFVRDFPVRLPPLAEQRDIAAFLDRETARIDAAVAAQERLIALLAEKRAGTISRAVTKGLDPDAPMKDSGIEWLGLIPAHWEIEKIGWQLDHRPRYGVLVPDDDPDGVPMLRIKDLTAEVASTDDLMKISQELSDQFPNTVVGVGDLVLSVVGTIGSSRIIGAELEGANLSRAIARLRPSRSVSTHFLRWIFESQPFQQYVDLTCVGTAQRVLNMDDLSVLRFGFPPVSEQKQIATALDEKIAKIDELIALAGKAAILLRERRAGLISSAVTGKIDVCEMSVTMQEAA